MSLTKVTYSMIDGAPVNVKDFGAVGDGVTDDANAVQAALDFIKSAGSGSLYFPSGVYLLDTKAATISDAVAEINSVQHLTISGEGYSSVIRVSDNLNWHFIQITDCEYVSITNLVCIGRDPTLFSGGHRAINFTNCQEVAVTHCAFKNWGRYAIAHQNGSAKGFIFDNLTFENIGNDCIDIKNQEAPANPTERLVVSNILAKSWGVTNVDSPDVVVDCRMPMSVSNVRGIGMTSGSRVIRIGSADCVVSNIFGVDDRTTPRTGIRRTAVIDLGNVTRCAISNIIAKNTDIGIWLQGFATQVSITNSVLEDCERGVSVGALSEHVVISQCVLKSCDLGINAGNSPHISVIGCKADSCNRFLQLGTNPFLTVVGNTVTNSGTGAWNITSGQVAENTYTFIGNTVDIAPATKSYLRSLDNKIAFSAVATNATHTSYLEARTGVSKTTLAADGTGENIDLDLAPKGTGNVMFGTHTANADAPISGFITIKDSNGTPRKLAVIT
jgi:hypothetical protein